MCLRRVSSLRDGNQQIFTGLVDGGYQAEWLAQWGRELKHTHKIDLEVTSHAGPGFQVVPWRWVVERTFAWLLNDRHHSRD